MGRNNHSRTEIWLYAYSEKELIRLKGSEGENIDDPHDPSIYQVLLGTLR